MVGILKIILSLFLLAGVLVVIKVAGKRLSLAAEVQRKLIHAGLGLYSLTFPWIFGSAWEVGLLTTLAALFLIAVRSVPFLKSGLGSGLHGVERFSLGEVFFAFSIGMVFFLAQGSLVLYILPLLILALSDAAAALVGSSYGRRSFPVEEGKKSWEGSMMFFLTAWLLSLIALLIFSGTPRVNVVFVSLITALIGTMVETTSWKGLDNLFLPLGLFLLLKKILPLDLVELAVVSSGFLFLLGIAMVVAKRFRFDLHAMHTIAVALFFFWIASGHENLFGPISVYLTSLFLNYSIRETPDPRQDLMVVLEIILIAIFWFTYNAITGYATAIVFNLALGIHLMFILFRSEDLRKRIGLSRVSLAALVLAMVTVSFRMVLFRQGGEPTGTLVAFSLGLLGLVLVLLNIFNKNITTGSWAIQVGLSLAISATGGYFVF